MSVFESKHGCRDWLRLSFALTASLYCLCPLTVMAEAGIIKSIKGEVTLLRSGQRSPATVGALVEVADMLNTGANSAVGITLLDGTALSAGPNSTLVINKFAFQQPRLTGELDATIKKGTLAVISGKLAKTSREAVVYRTPNAILGVRGTAFLIEVNEEEASQP